MRASFGRLRSSLLSPNDFRDARIGLGQRGLGHRFGLADVTMVAARLVGSSGAVTGVDRDASIIAKAKTRVAEAGLRNVTFVQSEQHAIPPDCKDASSRKRARRSLKIEQPKTSGLTNS